MAFSPDSKQLAVASRDHIVQVWDAATGACLQTLQSYESLVTSVSFWHGESALSQDLGGVARKMCFGCLLNTGLLGVLLLCQGRQW